MIEFTISEEMLVKEALAASNVIISITGPTAGETEDFMRNRKISELRSPAERIFWGISSPTCLVPDVQDLVAANGANPSYVMFFAGGTPPQNGGEARWARSYSTSRNRPDDETSREWQPTPAGICVKNVKGRQSCALVLGSYQVLESPIRVDFSAYTFFHPRHLEIKPGPRQRVASLTHQGRSTVCAKKGTHGALPSLHRLVGIAWLTKERAVWVRK